MIVQHPNGNSYLFIDNRVFVSAYNETTNSVITVELDIHNDLNDWEKEQIFKQPNHECTNVINGCYSGETVTFGETYCTSCNHHYEMLQLQQECELNSLENQSNEC